MIRRACMYVLPLSISPTRQPFSCNSRSEMLVFHLPITCIIPLNLAVMPIFFVDTSWTTSSLAAMRTRTPQVKHSPLVLPLYVTRFTTGKGYFCLTCCRQRQLNRPIKPCFQPWLRLCGIGENKPRSTPFSLFLSTSVQEGRRISGSQEYELNVASKRTPRSSTEECPKA